MQKITFRDGVCVMHGSGDTFLGHIGGDDFVVMAPPEQYAAVCEGIIEWFDKEMVHFYDKED